MTVLYTRAIKLSQTEGKGRFTRLIFLFASNRYKSLRIQSWRNNLRYNHNIITDEAPYNIFRKYHWKTYKITPKIAFFIKVFSFVFFVPKKRIIFAKVQRRKRGKIRLLYHLSFKLLVINWSNMLYRTIPKGNPPYEHINNQCIVHVISHHLPMQKVGLLSWSCCRKLW